MRRSPAGSQRGSVTGADGTYLIPGVAVGEREVRVQYIGFSSAARTVTVEAGATVTVDFELQSTVLNMEEIVVTGVACQSTRRRCRSRWNASRRRACQGALYIVDGVILASSVVDIDAMDIEAIEIVKGAAAASLFGSRAANGVIQITTNRGRNVANAPVGTYGY